MDDSEKIWIARRYYVTNFDIEQLHNAILSWVKLNGLKHGEGKYIDTWHKLGENELPSTDEHRVYHILHQSKLDIELARAIFNDKPGLIIRYRFPILNVYSTYKLPETAKSIVDEAITPCVNKMGGSLPDISPEKIIEKNNPIKQFEKPEKNKSANNGTQTQTSSTPQVHILNQKERIQVKTEEVHVPPGVIIKITRSRTIERVVEVNWKATGSAELGAGIKDLISASIVGEIEHMQGHSFKQSETLEYEVELNGDKSNCYKLSWVDIWQAGAIEYPLDNKTKVIPFRFNETSELKVSPV